MTSAQNTQTHGAASRSLTPKRVVRLASLVFFGALPAFGVYLLFADAIQTNTIATDLHQFYSAAQSIVDGKNPYAETRALWGGPYPYPPLPAILSIPLTALPFDVAGVLAMALLVCVALAIPAVLGVRDWRCYGLLLLWPPVISAIQTSNLTLVLGLCAAFAWRYRDQRFTAATSIGVTLAAKLFLWPLAVWLAATRRVVSAGLACAVGLVLLLLSWAAIGFAGLVDYPTVLQRLQDTVGDDSYTTYISGLDLGLPSTVSRALWLAVGLAVLASAVAVSLRGDERSGFILAITAALALTPIVWLHYFALLLVVVAVAQPALGLAWFLPLAMVITPGSGHPTPFQTAGTLAIAAVTIGVSLRSSMRGAAEQERLRSLVPAVAT
jgi:hypothetical protein